jgi:hypothetical protein
VTGGAAIRAVAEAKPAPMPSVATVRSVFTVVGGKIVHDEGVLK